MAAIRNRSRKNIRRILCKISNIKKYYMFEAAFYEERNRKKMK